MLKKKELKDLLKKHRAEWIYKVFREWIDVRDLKEAVDENGREVDREFVEKLFNNYLNNKRINMSMVRR